MEWMDILPLASTTLQIREKEQVESHITVSHFFIRGY